MRGITKGKFLKYNNMIFEEYFIYPDGRIIDLRNGNFLNLAPNSDGYLRTTITSNCGHRENIRVHRAVYETFRGDIAEGNHIHHLDGNRSNCKLDNLIQLTPSDHQLLHSKIDRPIRNTNAIPVVLIDLYTLEERYFTSVNQVCTEVFGKVLNCKEVLNGNRFGLMNGKYTLRYADESKVSDKWKVRFSKHKEKYGL